MPHSAFIRRAFAATVAGALLLAILPISGSAAQVSYDGQLVGKKVERIVEASNGTIFVVASQEVYVEELAAATFGHSKALGARVRDIAETSERVLVLATDEGVRLVNEEETQLLGSKEVALIGSPTVLHAAPDGQLLVGGRSGMLTVVGSSVAPVPALADVFVDDVAVGADGVMWVVSQGGELIRLDRDGIPAIIDVPVREDIEGADVKAVDIDGEGGIWVASVAGVARLAADARLLSVVPGGQQTPLDALGAFSVLADPRGGAWFGTDGGVRHVSQAGAVTNVDTGIDSNVWALLLDSDGGLWAGGESSLTRTPITTWSSDPILAGRAVGALLIDGDDTGWVGGDGFLARRTVGATVFDQRFPAELEVQDLARDSEGRLLVATDRGLFREEGSGLVLNDDLVPADSNVRALLSIDGDVWIGTTSGLYQLEQGAAEPTDHSDGLADSWVTSLWEGDRGEVWVGTSTGGAARYAAGSWSQVRRSTGGLRSDTIRAGLTTGTGTWFATEEGVDVAESATDPGARFRRPNSPLDQPAALLADGNGRLVWIGTRDGLAVVEDFLTAAFDTSDGLAGNEVLALSQEPNGRLWIGTDRGLTWHRDQGKGPALGVGFSVNGEAVTLDDLNQPLRYDREKWTIGMEARDRSDGAIDRFDVSVFSDPPDLELSALQIDTGPTFDIDLRAGFDYRVEAVAVDRHFNRSEPVVVEFSVSAKTLADVVAESWRAAAVTAAVLAAIFLAAVLFARRRLLSQRIPFEDYSAVIAESEPGKVRVELRYQDTVERGTAELDPAELIELEDNPQGVGEVLATALPPGSIRGRLVQAEAARLRLQVAGTVLHEMPWEALHVPERAFLGRSNVAIVRDLGGTQPRVRLRLFRPLRALVVAASPESEDLDALDMRDEITAIKEAYGEQRVTVLDNATFSGLRRRLETRGRSFDVVHVAAHGTIRDSIPMVILHGDEDPSDIQLVSADELAEVLHQHARALLVVLNVCNSDRRTARGGLIAGDWSDKVGGIGASLVSKGAALAAIGMAFEVENRAATRFASALHGAFARSGQIDNAIRSGRVAVEGETRQWLAPRLYTNRRDGKLFR